MLEKIGKFRVIKPLGKGSMGEVLLAEDEVLGRQVAIKTVLPGTSFGQEAQARFVREAKATAGMNHPNIVTVFDFGEQEGLHYLVMELVEGTDLESLIAKGSLSKIELLEVLAQTCEGLGYAHDRGIIHRDVKPANILVTRAGRKLQAKLTDFGVALVDRSNLTDDGVWMGTVSYMAPEYLDTGKATSSSDLFAVGVMLYEALTGGRKPFTGETTTGILNAILRKSAEPLTARELGELPPAILQVATKALAKSPEDRFPDADALAHAIRQAAQTPAAAAAPTPTPPRPAAPAEPQGTERLVIPNGGRVVVGKGPGANCLSLRVALRQASPGAHISVLPGLFREALVIDKEVTLTAQGEPGEVILESPAGPCLKVEGGSVTLQGFALRSVPGNASTLVLARAGEVALERCRLESSSDTLIETGHGTSLRLEECTLIGGGAQAVILGENAAGQVINSALEGAGRALLRAGAGASLTLQRARLERARGVGLLLEPNAQATLEGCELNDLWAGSIEAGPDTRLQLRQCTLAGSGFAGLLALERSSALLEECTFTGHRGAAVHLLEGANVQLRQCTVKENDGFGLSLSGKGTLNAEGCEIARNRSAGVHIHREGTAQLKDCKVIEGGAVGLVCAAKGRGVLEGCEIAGNAQSGAKVEAGASLLLVRCTIRDGQDTGIMLFEDAEATLEECVVHRNARGGILLAKDGADPILRGGNTIEDDLVRMTDQGPVKLAPVKKR